MLKFEKIPQIPQTTKLGGKTKNKKKTWFRPITKNKIFYLKIETK